MKSTSDRIRMLLFPLLAAAMLGGRSLAQEVLPAPPAPFNGQIGLGAKNSKSDSPQPVHAPKGPQRDGG